jgi:hypothetical protein
VRAAWRVYSGSFNARVRRRYALRDTASHPLDFRAPPVADDRFQVAMRDYRPTRHREWLYDIRALSYIEPARGFVFGPRGEWFRDSFNYHHMVDDVPVGRLASLFRRRAGIRTVECAVSLRCFTEGNYWHFYDDFLSKLRLVDELGLAPDVPLLVGERLWRQPFFAQATLRGSLRGRNWTRHIAPLRLGRLIIAVPMSFQKANIQSALSMLEAPPPKQSARRLFVNRGKSRGRQLTNVHDLLPVLDEFGFEMVDPDGMSLADQMVLFGAGRLVVANHGASLANLAFRVGQPVDVVELFSPDFIHPHFVWMAHAFAFGYDALVGEQVGGGDFRIDPRRFRAVIAAVVARVEAESAASAQQVMDDEEA